MFCICIVAKPNHVILYIQIRAAHGSENFAANCERQSATFVVLPDQHRPSPLAGGMLQLGGTLQTIITRTFTCLG